jgi:lipopolysaccharide export system permease protein
MLFDSSLRKELSRTFGAALVVLITVVMSMLLIRTLGLASKGNVNPQDVMMLMGYAVLGHLPTILTLSLFIAVTATISRMYRDSEMAVWFSSGRGLASFARPLLRFALPVLVIIVLMALFVWPWSNQQSQLLRERYETRGDLDRVAAGQFQENSSGTRVFFIERSDAATSEDEVTVPVGPPAPSTADATATGNTSTSSTTTSITASNKVGRNIFIASNEQGKQATTSARSGRIEMVGDDQFLILNNGQRLEQTKEDDTLKISEFGEYGTKVGQIKLGEPDKAPPKALNSIDLLRQRTAPYLAELGWRLGLGLAAFNLVLLALVASASNPRSGRGYSLAFALLAFVVYYNLLNVGQAWVGDTRVGFVTWTVGLHGGVLLITGAWLAARHMQWSPRNWLTARATTST